MISLVLVMFDAAFCHERLDVIDAVTDTLRADFVVRKPSALVPVLAKLGEREACHAGDLLFVKILGFNHHSLVGLRPAASRALILSISQLRRDRKSMKP